MKKSVYILFSFIICINLVIMNGCNHNKEGINRRSKVAEISVDYEGVEYDTYKIVGLAQDGVKEKEIRISKEKEIIYEKSTLDLNISNVGYVSEVGFTKEGNIVCAFLGTVRKSADKLHIIEKGKLKSYKTFDQWNMAKRILVDREENIAYFFGSVNDKGKCPEGTPLRIVDLTKKELIKTLYFKGEIYGRYMNDSYVYISVLLGKNHGYTEVEDSFIARINKETKEYEMLSNEEMINGAPMQIVCNEDNDIYGVSCIIPWKDGGVVEPKLIQYDAVGKVIKESELSPWCGKIEITHDGIIYIAHIGKKHIGGNDGEIISVFDIEKDEVIEVMEGFDGVMDLAVEGDYLFVANYITGNVIIIDNANREVIGEINLSEKGRLDRIEVIKY